MGIATSKSVIVKMENDKRKKDEQREDESHGLSSLTDVNNDYDGNFGNTFNCTLDHSSIGNSGDETGESFDFLDFILSCLCCVCL